MTALRGYARWRASGRFPEVVRLDALHEAGHAVTAEALGGPVELVTLGIRDGWEYRQAYMRYLAPGDTVPRRHERVAIVSLAGHAADGRDWLHAEGCGDRADARAAAERVTAARAERDELLDRLRAIACRLVRRHRPAIERLAAELLAEETITGERVRAILTR